MIVWQVSCVFRDLSSPEKKDIFVSDLMSGPDDEQAVMRFAIETWSAQFADGRIAADYHKITYACPNGTDHPIEVEPITWCCRKVDRAKLERLLMQTAA